MRIMISAEVVSIDFPSWMAAELERKAAKEGWKRFDRDLKTQDSRLKTQDFLAFVSIRG